VQITLNYWPILEPLVKSGKLRALAIAAPVRHPAIPDIPTFAEAGVPGIEMYGWTGLFVPAGTPPAIIDRLQKGISQILQTPALRDEIIRSGGAPGGNTPAEFAAFWHADRARTGKTLADAGIAPE
jgi:tripartite-type tricarboxylate transporter receptor subunit TctC